jgi:hypothetical protein
VVVAKRPSKLDGLRKALRWVKVEAFGGLCLVHIHATGLVRSSRGGGRLKMMRELGEGCISAGESYLQGIDIDRIFRQSYEDKAKQAVQSISAGGTKC